MKIYTKTGDDGSTGLIGGRRVSKADPRIECYGTIDELNAAVGLAAVGAEPAMLQRLRQVQNELFIIGSILAAPHQGGAGDSAQPPLSESSLVVPQLSETSIERLEAEIDSAEASLSALQNFILPGGSELSARVHLARTICRRAERLLVGLAEAQGGGVDLLLVKYLNRLSDWLFVQARLANHQAGVSDLPWTK